MLPEQQQRILGYFIEEAKDHLNTIEQGLLNLQNTIDDQEMANEVFRAAHSVKGGAAMLGIHSIQKTAHRLEDYFKELKEQPIQADQKLETLFLRVFDTLQSLLDHLQGPFGLTEDVAEGIMAGADPVFEELGQHLDYLVKQPTPAKTEKPKVADSQKQLVVAAFTQDVMEQLRQMLQLFKPPSWPDSRPDLEECCDRLASYGHQFNLSTWLELVEMAKGAISNPDNTSQVLAPVIIKEIKAAQELVVAGRIAEICGSEQLRSLQPVIETSTSDELSDNLDELFSLVEEAGTPEETPAQLAENFADFDTTESPENYPELEHSGEDLWGTQTEQPPLQPTAFANFEDREPSVKSAYPHGPEVGAAELNSLADIFENELEFDVDWQEEEIVSDTDKEQGPDLADHLDVEDDNEFNDLLEDFPQATTDKSDLFDDDLDLFGDDLLEEENSNEIGDSKPFNDFGSDNEFADLFELSETEPTASIQSESDIYLGLSDEEILAEKSTDELLLETNNANLDSEFGDDLFGDFSQATTGETFSEDEEIGLFDESDTFLEEDNSPENIRVELTDFEQEASSLPSNISSPDTPDNLSALFAGLDEDDLNWEDIPAQSDRNVESEAQTAGTSQVLEIENSDDSWNEGWNDEDLTALATSEDLDTELTAEETDLDSFSDFDTELTAEETDLDSFSDFDTELTAEETDLDSFSDFDTELTAEETDLDSFSDFDTELTAEETDLDSFSDFDTELTAEETDLDSFSDFNAELKAEETTNLETFSDLNAEFSTDTFVQSEELIFNTEEQSSSDNLWNENSSFDDLTETEMNWETPNNVEEELINDFDSTSLFGESTELTLESDGNSDLFADSNDTGDLFGFNDLKVDSEDIALEENSLWPTEEIAPKKPETPAKSAAQQKSNVKPKPQPEESLDDFFSLEQETQTELWGDRVEQPLLQTEETGLDDNWLSGSQDLFADSTSSDLWDIGDSTKDSSLMSDFGSDGNIDLFTNEGSIETDFTAEFDFGGMETAESDTSLSDEGTIFEEFLDGDNGDRETLLQESNETTNDLAIDAFEENWDTETGTDNFHDESDAESESWDDKTDDFLNDIFREPSAVEDDRNEALPADFDLSLENQTTEELPFDLAETTAENWLDFSEESEQIADGSIEPIESAANDNLFDLGLSDLPDVSEDNILDEDSTDLFGESATAEMSATDLEAADEFGELWGNNDFDNDGAVEPDLTDISVEENSLSAEGATEENWFDSAEDGSWETNEPGVDLFSTSEEEGDLGLDLEIVDETVNALFDSDDGQTGFEASGDEAAFDFAGLDISEENDRPTESVNESINFDADFDELESLLNQAAPEPLIPPTTNGNGKTTVNDEFAELEALLGSELEIAPPTAAPAAQKAPSTNGASSSGELDDDFAELERMVAEDKLPGGTPSGPKARANQVQLPKQRARPTFEQTMKVPVKHMDNLSNLVGELVVNRNTLEQDQERLRQCLDNLLNQVQQLSDVGARMQDLYERSLLEASLLASRRNYRSSLFSDGSDSSHHNSEYDPLEMDRFTGFHTLSQEMIELIVRVRESTSDIEFVTDETDQVSRQFRQVSTQLQEGLTRARMVPFGEIERVFPLQRYVRDKTAEYGKQAEVRVEGRETLIDKLILEHFSDPLKHLVNNALAHGIEKPEVRQKAGKPPVGRIVIRAFHQGNQTVISFSDDGAGIDMERVKSKAIQKGLITASEAKTMSRHDIYQLIYHPGFSTKDEADSTAGRGVGMDVVLTSLSEIRGTITTDSNPGKGTSFTVRLPLTLSICKALCCLSERARIAFPMDGVEDALDIEKERIQIDADGNQCIPWRDMVLPFRHLSELLTFNRHLGRGSVYGGTKEEDTVSIVVLRSAGNFIALQVDQVLGEQEIVIKQLEGPMPKPLGVAGATVLGDGRIMPIGDVLELIDLSLGRIQGGSPIWAQGEGVGVVPEPLKSEEPTVLIVDDSITVRELLSMTFNKAGYRVEQARDGQEAWEKLRSGLPCQIVFCDIEMPKMDGLELLSRLQKDPDLNHLPVAMLTSRGADKHRQMAIERGARGYFTKPYLEEALLDAASRMLKGEVLVTSNSNA